MAALKPAKRELRRRMRRILAGVTGGSAAAQTNRVVNTLFTLPEYESARRISVYLSMPQGEISTSAIVTRAMAEGKTVFVPYTYERAEPSDAQPASVMDMLALDSTEDFQSLKPDAWGIPTPDQVDRRKNCMGGWGKSEGGADGGLSSPSPGTERESRQHAVEQVGLDLVVMPGMAFDNNMGRLGHGKGYYDFFLQRYTSWAGSRAKPVPFLVGLALQEQVLENESVPADDSDWRLDALISGDGTLQRR